MVRELESPFRCIYFILTGEKIKDGDEKFRVKAPSPTHTAHFSSASLSLSVFFSPNLATLIQKEN